MSLFVVNIHRTITEKYIVDEDSGNKDIAEHRALNEPSTCEGPATESSLVITSKEVQDDVA